jgi:hypothetical protein
MVLELYLASQAQAFQIKQISQPKTAFESPNLIKFFFLNRLLGECRVHAFDAMNAPSDSKSEMPSHRVAKKWQKSRINTEI